MQLAEDEFVKNSLAFFILLNKTIQTACSTDIK
jgi:hypothetical protein